MLITRGALTTFSIANDVAKYFAIIPAMLVMCSSDRSSRHHGAPFTLEYDAQRSHFQCPRRRGLIPLALRGVHFRPLGATVLLKRGLLIYGLVRLVPVSRDQIDPT